MTPIKSDGNFINFLRESVYTYPLRDESGSRVRENEKWY